jgi:hypothetical protein
MAGVLYGTLTSLLPAQEKIKNNNIITINVLIFITYSI